MARLVQIMLDIDALLLMQINPRHGLYNAKIPLARAEG